MTLYKFYVQNYQNVDSIMQSEGEECAKLAVMTPWSR
jgi:hypothetical protein